MARSAGPAVRALRASLGELAKKPDVLDKRATAVLRSAICAAVDELKVDGLTVERITVAVERLADEAGLSPPPVAPAEAPAEATPSSPDLLVSTLVHWCIERYSET